MKHSKTLARKISDDLFTNGLDQKAVRLVLLDKNGKGLGGWCEKAVIDRVGEMLSENVCKPDSADLQEALSLLDLAMHQGEYGVGEDVRKRYEALKERYKQ